MLEGWTTKPNTLSACLQIDYPTGKACDSAQKSHQPQYLGGKTSSDQVRTLTEDPPAKSTGICAAQISENTGESRSY